MLLFNIDILPTITHFGYVSFKEPWAHFRRIIDEYILFIIKSGELYIIEGENKYILKKGDFFILQPGFIHSGFQKACCDYYYIHFKHPEISEVEDRPRDEIARDIMLRHSMSLRDNLAAEKEAGEAMCYLPKHYHIANNSTGVYIFYILKEALEDYNKKYEYYKNVSASRLLELIIKVSREFISIGTESYGPSFPKAFVKCQAILDYINNEYHQRIRSQDIEQRFESNYAYLNRVFHRMTGHTILNYLNMVRINKAKELIETTPIKFSEIGYLVGIDDPYYFSRIFKKYMGMSPMKYCKNAYGK